MAKRHAFQPVYNPPGIPGTRQYGEALELKREIQRDWEDEEAAKADDLPGWLWAELEYNDHSIYPEGQNPYSCPPALDLSDPEVTRYLETGIYQVKSVALRALHVKR